MVQDVADQEQLPFDGRAWNQLIHFAHAAQQLPRTALELPAGIRRVLPDASQREEVVSELAALQSLGLEFGGPRADVRAGSESDAGESIYGRVREFVASMRGAAGQYAGALRALAGPAPDNLSIETRAEATRLCLRQLADISAQRMNEATPILLQLTDWSARVSAAMASIDKRQAQVIKTMSSAQELVGELEYTIRTRQPEVDKPSILHPGRKRKATEELEAAKAQLPATRDLAEGYRALVAILEGLTRANAWLPTGVKKLEHSLSTIRQEWSQFGTGLRQLSMDGDSTELGDAEWVSKALDPEGAAAVWDRVGKVMSTFMERNK